MKQPKKRVYELARELNMTNKSLLEKISSLDLGLKSHMSTLNEDSEAQIRQFMKGGALPGLDEKRVKPTVIRRRRKVVDVAPKPPEEPDADDQETVEPIPGQPTAVDVEEAQSAASEAQPSEESTPAAQVPEARQEPDASEAQVPEPHTAPPPQETAKKPVTAKAPKAKKKIDPAAKIIKLPEKPAASEPKPKKATAAPISEPLPLRQVPAVVPEPPPKEVRGKKRGKKRGGRFADQPTQKPYAKKRSSFRKKSVVEGADLYSGRGRSRKRGKRGRGKAATPGLKTQITTAKAIKRRLKIDEAIVLAELAKRMGIKAADIITKLMGLGVMATVNQTIDFETASLVAAEFDYEIEKASFEEEELLRVQQDDDPDKLLPRPPVVTIMGHVDHGKTSLLDVIRQSSVTEGEAGGITQHIGAYLVTTDKGDIAFLDTPGHEAFSAMRNRGAQVTDIVILVVAADDGVMPQTIEAINHSKAAQVPIIVAVNKMDKPDANPERVTRQLSEIGIVPEDWGGENIFVQVSAKEQTGLDDLLEMILLQSEMLELKANPDKLALGHVVEAKLDSGRGAVATVLVKEGTLKVGDPVVCGVHHGKVRALLDDLGDKVESAGPSNPVEIIGLSGVPMAGDEMVVVNDEKDARQVSRHRIQKQRSKDLAKESHLSLEKLFEKMQQGELRELNLIIKADVDGSLEAIRDSVLKLSNEEVKINILHSATGTIRESDIPLAAVSDAIIIGFNVRANTKVQEMAAEEHVDIRYHNLIFNVTQEIKDAILGMMKSTFEEHILGRADVRDTFHVPKVGTIAGCYITDGKIKRGNLSRLLRDGVVIYDGKNSSLRRFKDDVKEVQSGFECGISLEKYNDIKVGDVIEAYYLEEILPEME